MRAIKAFSATCEHVGMLLRGEVAEFAELALGGLAADALDDLTRGLRCRTTSRRAHASSSRLRQSCRLLSARRPWNPMCYVTFP